MKNTSRFLSNAGIDALRPYAAVETLSADDLTMLASTPLDCHSMLMMHNLCCCNHRHGLTKSDFSAATVLFCLPRHAFCIDKKEVANYDNIQLLCFNSELCRQQADLLDNFTFFRYDDKEALHISESEHSSLQKILSCIEKEQQHDIDDHSEAIMTHLVAVAFNFCLRLYGRQFILRSDINSKAIEALHALIDSHYASSRPLAHPTPPPSTEQLAGSLKMSAQYLEDLCRHESGLSVEQHIKLRRVEMAQNLLATTSLSASAIARKCGFSSVCCLNSILEKTIGAISCCCGKGS